MASPNTLINLSGFQDGVAADETGINIKEFKTKVEPEFRNKVPNKYGAVRGIVVAPMMLEVSLSGEVTGATGIMAAVATSATSLSNSTAYFGAPSTGKYLKSAEVTENRDGGALKEMSAEFDAHAGIA
jgi:hypothetical protein